MGLHLYNTLTKREEEFIPLQKGKVTMYTCGPTVYGRPHIGNYASFLMADLLRRWLEVGHGLTVTHVKNITDVGHLLHDADHGDDKIQKEAEKEKLHPLEVARRYEREFLEDERALNLLDPDKRPRASEYIKEQLTMIDKLLTKKYAYEVDDGIYFDVSTFPHYGALSGNTLEDLSAGVRVKVDEKKRHPADFALWKKCIGDNARHVLRWNFATGEMNDRMGEDPSSGFPGWHIECSAMSSSLLGDQIDIHTGGEDNIFPHHECEIAQSESATGQKPFVRYWIHRRRINLGSVKMSKSLGNLLTLSDIQTMGYSPLDLRYYLLSVHYRTNLKFTQKGLNDAHKARRKIMDWMEEMQNEKHKGSFKKRPSRRSGGVMVRDFAKQNRLEPSSPELLRVTHFSEFPNNDDKWQLQFKQAMNADLNTPKALSVIFDAMNAFYRGEPSGCGSLKGVVCRTFGCFEDEKEGIPGEIQVLVDRREAARREGDFKAADALRNEILALGYEIRDGEGGAKLRKQAKK